MPLPSDHAAILREPDDFAEEPAWKDGGGGRFRRKPDGTIYGSKKIPQNVHVLWGKLKGEAGADDPPVPESLLFPTSDWTVSEAKRWLSEQEIDYLRFEPATGREAEPMTERRGVVQFEALPVYDGSRWDATAAERRVREWAAARKISTGQNIVGPSHGSTPRRPTRSEPTNSCITTSGTVGS